MVKDLSSDCRALNSCSVLGALSGRWNGEILNDKGVKIQGCGIVQVVDSILDKKAM